MYQTSRLLSLSHFSFGKYPCGHKEFTSISQRVSPTCLNYLSYGCSPFLGKREREREIDQICDHICRIILRFRVKALAWQVSCMYVDCSSGNCTVPSGRCKESVSKPFWGRQMSHYGQVATSLSCDKRNSVILALCQRQPKKARGFLDTWF